MKEPAPLIYLPHGGGPMPLLGDPAQAALSEFLRALPAGLAKPEAILMISAHWEEDGPALYADSKPGMLFDYYGFPPETYKFSYPAPGNPELAKELAGILREGGFSARLVEGRGYDHGAFVPLMLMYPDAKIPCLQLSLVTGLDPAQHLRLGACLHELRQRGVAIIGSGMSFHNLRAIFAGENVEYRKASNAFANWLVDTLGNRELSSEARLARLTDWREAPFADFCHPRAEHLLPLHVCAGAAQGAAADVLFDAPVMGHRVNGFGWH